MGSKSGSTLEDQEMNIELILEMSTTEVRSIFVFKLKHLYLFCNSDRENGLFWDIQKLFGTHLDVMGFYGKTYIGI